MLEIQCNQIIKGLALDDATTAKFIPVYKQYMEEMISNLLRHVRHIHHFNITGGEPSLNVRAIRHILERGRPLPVGKSVRP